MAYTIAAAVSTTPTDLLQLSSYVTTTIAPGLSAVTSLLRLSAGWNSVYTTTSSYSARWNEIADYVEENGDLWSRTKNLVLNTLIGLAGSRI